MPEIEADAVCAGMTHDSAEEDGGWKEREVRVLFAVAEVPEHRRSWGADAIGVRRVDSERGASSGDEGWHGEVTLLQLSAKFEHGLKGGVTPLGSGGEVRIVDVSVVSVKAEDFDGR